MLRLRPATLLGLLLVAALLQACNLAAYQARQPAAAPAQGSAAVVTRNAPVQTGAEPAAGSAATGTAPAAGEAPVPAGWAAYSSDSLGLAMLLPEGWESLQSGEYTLDLHEAGGDGWAQLTVLTGENARSLGISFEPGATSAELLDTLLLAFREDGDFSAPTELQTASGDTLAFSGGVYEPHREQLLIAAKALPGRAAILVGHGPPAGAEGEGAEWARLSEVYLQIAESIEAAP